MKANRKFLHGDEEAVSPVIAVILMVAITVVLAATVYVWVSGFGSNSNTSVAHTMSLASAGSIAAIDTSSPADGVFEEYTKSYTVSSADPSLKYGDIKLTIAGNEYTLATTCAPAADKRWSACAGTTVRGVGDPVLAGDLITIKCTVAGSGATCLDNKALLLLDKSSNSVMVSLTVR